MEMPQRQELIDVIVKLKKVSKHLIVIPGISQGEIVILHKIVQLQKGLQENEPGVKISELSKAATMSKPAVSQMLNALENKALIERVTTKVDRRVVYVKLTDQGHEQFKNKTSELTNLLDKIVNELGEEDTESLVHLLGKLNDIIENIEV